MRQYIGARYVTKIYENSQDPGSCEWESGVVYEPLTIVSYQNSSYLSKQMVPANAGNPATATSYWAQTGFYNGQIAQLENDINDIHAIISTPEMFGVKISLTYSKNFQNNFLLSLLVMMKNLLKSLLIKLSVWM